MKAVVLVACFISALTLTSAFRCQHEKDLDASTNETEFQIKPQKSLEGKFLWITSMNIFLFGNIERKHNAKIQAGFYNDKTGALVYKVIINCEDGTWKTMYDRAGNGNVRKWKEGALNGGCQVGDFDLIANIGCPEREDLIDMDLLCAKQAYFVFNGQVLETNFQTVPRYETQYTETLPVYIRSGKLFKAKVLRDGASFTQEAYGKCFEFPARYHSNCMDANKWLLTRSNNAVFGLDVFGLWDMQYTVECVSSDSEEPNSAYFRTLQKKIIPDGSAIYGSQKFNTCCCSYLDGHVQSAECLNNFSGNNCITRPGYEETDERCNKYNSFFMEN